MLKSFLMAMALTLAFVTSAFAYHCPADVKAIDNALSKMSLPQAKMAEIKALRDKGDAAHKAGKHKEAVDALAKAMRISLNSQ